MEWHDHTDGKRGRRVTEVDGVRGGGMKRREKSSRLS